MTASRPARQDTTISPGHIAIHGPVTFADWEGEEARQRRKVRGQQSCQPDGAKGLRKLVAFLRGLMGMKARQAAPRIFAPSDSGWTRGAFSIDDAIDDSPAFIPAIDKSVTCVAGASLTGVASVSVGGAFMRFEEAKLAPGRVHDQCHVLKNIHPDDSDA